MSIETQINPETNTITRSVVGELTVDDVTQAIAESLLDPDFRENMNVIWDLTKGDTSKLSAENIMAILQHIQSHFNNRGADYKISIVAPKDINFGISRMFESYGNDLPVSINVYRNIDEAYNWIKN